MADLIEKNNQIFGNYYDRINNLILKTKQNVVKNINSEMVELYFEIGSTINELIENYNLEASQNEILKLDNVEKIESSDETVSALINVANGIRIVTGVVLILLIIISSLFIERVFCRYLCPLGGVFTLISKLRLFNIKKDLNKCIDCNLCSKKCPMNIDVNKETSEYNKVKSSECIDCFKCINTCPVNALYTKPNEALTGSVAALTIAGLYYGGTLIANSNITNNNVNNPVITNGKYKDGTYYGTGNGYRGEVKVKVIVDKGSITSITIESYKDDDQFFNKAKNTIINNIISTQSTDVATVSGATYSSKGIISAVINALDLTNNIESDNEEPSNNTFTNLVDGTYEGTGTGRNGDIVVSVVVKDKKVTSITIESSREDTRYIDAAKDTVINNIITKQSLDVDTVSGATMSSNGIIDAVANALNISFTNPNDTLDNKGQHHNRPNK